MTSSDPASQSAPNCNEPSRAKLIEHQRWLRTVVYARAGSPEAVDDVMQEVFAAACSSGLPHDPGKVAPWLYRIAVRQALLYRRKAGRRRKLVTRYRNRLKQSDGHSRGDPLTWLVADERRQMVREALARIAPRDAEILLLKYSEDWSYRQMAEHLGMSIAAVQARLHRARQHLRRELRASGVGETVSEKSDQ